MVFAPSPGVADLGYGDKNLEVITGADEWYPQPKVSGRWYAFDANGNLLWTLDTGSDESRSSVAIADLDNDGDLEIAGGTTSGWQIQVFDHTGKMIWTFDTFGGYYVHSSPAIADVCPDKLGLEVVAASYDGLIYCLDSSGKLVWTFGEEWGDVWVASPAVGDVDADGMAEVVIGSCNFELYEDEIWHEWESDKIGIYCLDGATGTQKWAFRVGSAFTSSAAIANLDNDGPLEIVVGSIDGNIYCLDGATGALQWAYKTGGAVYSSPAIGDINVDGKLEVVVGSNDGMVYALDAATGSLLFAYQTSGAIYSSPALANRGGGRLAIYVGSEDHYLHLIDGKTGLPVDKFLASGPIRSSPVVADIDGDERLEILFVDWNKKGGRRDWFWCLEDTQSSVSKHAIEWGMFRHDERRTGLYPMEVTQVIDTTPPASSVDIITPYWRSATPFTITATASDDLSGVSMVELFYRYSNDNMNWGPWTSFSVDNESPWSWLFTGTKGDNYYPDIDGYYEFYSIATDTAGNKEIPPATDIDAQAGIDTIPPTSSVDPTEPYWQNSTPFTITATASDNLSGVENVELFYRYSSDNSNWGLWNSFGADNASPWSWAFTAYEGDGYYEFFSVGVDMANNVEAPPLGQVVYENFVLTNPIFEWDIQTVDSTENVDYYLPINYTSIALDSSWNPHISYYDETDRDLKYARWTGSSWSIETVDSAGSVGWFTSIAVDSFGNPHISYWDRYDYYDDIYDYHTSSKAAYKTDDLMYAHWTGSSWDIQTADSAGDVGQWTSITLDFSNYPHISYYDYTNGALKYIYWTGSSWEVQTVDSAGDVGHYTSITLDSSGYPHISYHDWTNHDLKYARWMGSTWSIETVDSAGSVGWFTSIAVDSFGNPHISYSDYTNYALKYAHWTGSSWDIQTVYSAGNVIQDTSISLDSYGKPHISYRDGINGDLKYARWMGSTWSIETVDPGRYPGGSTSIALDSSGNPHISYSNEGALKYARGLGVADASLGIDRSSPVSKVDDITPYWQSSASLTLTATATDALSGVASVALYYHHSADNLTFTPWTEVATDTTAPWEWTLDPTENIYYEFYSVARDVAGNVETPPRAKDFTHIDEDQYYAVQRAEGLPVPEETSLTITRNENGYIVIEGSGIIVVEGHYIVAKADMINLEGKLVGEDDFYIFSDFVYTYIEEKDGVSTLWLGEVGEGVRPAPEEPVLISYYKGEGTGTAGSYVKYENGTILFAEGGASGSSEIVDNNRWVFVRIDGFLFFPGIIMENPIIPDARCAILQPRPTVILVTVRI
ncbi:MAG: PQQ-binding-like beta-propeller repeat protein, partial [Hadesarchaea archaeon]|nr:PQQ-binding-like beta-propeller repeat protein [Hadesarchaea archaeon]